MVLRAVAGFVYTVQVIGDALHIVSGTCVMMSRVIAAAVAERETMDGGHNAVWHVTCRQLLCRILCSSYCQESGSRVLYSSKLYIMSTMT